ncbi:MAG: Holliday junction branch migration protein RuvA [Anaerolineae bacterium]
MIARLRGQVRWVGQDALIVDVGGVGYRVRVPRGLLDRVGIGEAVQLHTHLHVRENEMALYGCASEEELALFEALLGVSGIGPRSALNILSATAPEALRTIIASGDVAALSRIPGIGRRTAERLVTELKDRLGGNELSLAGNASMGDAEVVAALTALGYSVVEAQQALRNLPPSPDLPLEERLRAVLKGLVRE